MLRRRNIENYLKQYLQGKGDRYNPLPAFGSGSGSSAVDLSPDRLVLLSLGSGPGLSTEYVIDQPNLQVRTVGMQFDYDDAEQLALDCDLGLLAIDHSQYVDGVWVTSIVRAGGRPQELEQDDGDRFHFTCNYIIGAEADLDG